MNNLKDLEKIFGGEVAEKNKVLSTDEISKELIRYFDIMQGVNFSIITFNNLNKVFDKLGILNLILDFAKNEKIINEKIGTDYNLISIAFGYDKDFLKITENDSEEKREFKNKEYSKIFRMYLLSYSNMNMLLNNVRYAKDFNGSPLFVNDSELKQFEPKYKRMFFVNKGLMKIMEIELQMNLITQKLINSGDTREEIQNRNIIESIYKYCRLLEV